MFPYGTPKEQQSEDCLYLTVYRPGDSTGKSLPVLVFIHGGAFMSGSGDFAMQQPTEWMDKYPEFIFVNLNYRLNAFGFFALDTVNEDDVHGNFGLYDQNAALKWVYDNIAHFGGDKDQITLMGQNAGGQSAIVHTIWEESSQYFNKLIIDSAPTAIPTGANDTDYYRHMGKTFLQETDYGFKNGVSRIR